jgi:hypothetical protein
MITEWTGRVLGTRFRLVGGRDDTGRWTDILSVTPLDEEAG